MVKHYLLHIHGHVQGVFFRESAKQKADEFGITGYVRNEPDNSVYIEAEGEEKNLKKFITWCHQGPKYAKVGKVEINESNELQNFENFTIWR